MGTTTLTGRDASLGRLPRRLTGTLRRVLTEPLLHFVLLGGLAFALWPLIADRVGGAPDRSHRRRRASACGGDIRLHPCAAAQ